MKRWLSFASHIAMLVALLGLPVSRAEAGIFDPWTWKINVGFDGYTKSESLTNFPVLIQFEEGSNQFSYAQLASPSNAADLRFTSADDQTELPYEIELWNTSGVSYVWVRATITGATDSIWAHWGRGGQEAPAYTTNGVVWDSGYGGVWHLGEAVSDGGAVYDSTTNRNHGIFYDADADSETATNTVVGKGMHLSGDADYISVSNRPSLNPTQAITMEAWVMSDNANWNTYWAFITKLNSYLLGGLINTREIRAYFYDGTWPYASFVPASVTTWRHYVGTYDRSRIRLYIDGVQVASTARTTAISTTTNAVRIGRDRENAYYLDGWLDEVRLSSVARSTNWVWASFMNQASNRNFLSYSNAETLGGRPVIYNQPPTNISADSAFMNGYQTSTGTSQTAVWLFWGNSDGGDATSGLWQATNQWVAGEWTEGSYPTFQATGMDVDTTYYYRFFATNDAGASWPSTSANFMYGAVTMTGITNASERGLAKGAFEVYRPASATDENLVVHFAVDDTVADSATEGVDYTLDAYSVTIPQGQTSAVIIVHILADDVEPEADETVKLVLQEGYYIIGTPSNATIVITNHFPASPTNVWISSGDSSAATAGNWSLGSPTDAHHILAAGYSTVDLTWSDTATNRVASWTQTENYTGTVTIQTKYPAGGSFTNFVITGDCVISNGVWTHTANSGDTLAYDRLTVSVGGNFTVGALGEIDLWGRGFAASRGPGAGVGGQRAGKAASHGGQGGYITTLFDSPASCYGSPTRPEMPGSGGAVSKGGGTLRVMVAGHAEINGAINSDGQPPQNVTTNRYQGASGGSILIQAATVAGSGSLSAIGGWGYDTGGGGRIAVVVTNGASLGSLTFSVRPGTPATSRMGTAGTIYRETTAGKQLVIDQRSGELNTSAQSGLYTEILPAYETYDPHPVVGGELEDATLILTNGALAALTTSLRMGDFAWIDSGSTLYLQGWFFYLKADEPLGTFPDDYGNGPIVYEGGDIIWGNQQPQMVLALTAGPDGSVSRNPNSLDDLHAFDSDVEITATPDPGYDFVFWTGDIPAGSNRTSNPLTVTMDQRRDIRALFASSAANTFTWIGDGPNILASTASNWYPAVTPGAGAHIVLNASSDKDMDWDLEIVLSSWTQKEGYTYAYDLVLGTWGRVTIPTRYPGYGTFTNLVITGDCTLNDGRWTHPANTGGDIETDRLWVTVGSNFTLGAAAMVDLYGRGYAASKGPGAGNGSQRSPASGIGASHGGRGATGTDVPSPSVCYGSVMAPVNLGSGAGSWGGGALRLEAGGAVHIDGTMDARGTTASSQNPSGSGGSIWITADSLSGSGELDVTAIPGYQPGGGGRISVVLRESDDFGDVIMLAHGGDNVFLQSRRGSAGTIYRQGSSQAGGRGTVTVDNNNYVVDSAEWHTELPPTLPVAGESLSGVTLVMTNRAYVGITTNVTMGDLFVRGNTPVQLRLQGNVLRLNALYHPDWGSMDNVVEDGGRIVWREIGTVIFVR